MFARFFTSHPASIGESYFQHLVHALGFGFAMLTGAAACMVHALIPGLFAKTGSEVVARLHGRMVVNRIRQSDDAAGQPCTRHP